MYIISIGKFGVILPLKFEIDSFLVICYQGKKINHHILPKLIKVTKSGLPWCLEKCQEANFLISRPLLSKVVPQALVVSQGDKLSSDSKYPLHKCLLEK